MLAIAQATSVVKVAMGGVDLAKAPDVLETLLGSCVGIAIWDRSTGHGGLAHVVLPYGEGQITSPGKYADTAVDYLKTHLIKKGANPLGLRAKIAGGARMFGPASRENIGTRNIGAAIECLAAAKIPIVAEHVGGEVGRVINFCLATGSLTVQVRRETAAVI